MSYKPLLILPKTDSRSRLRLGGGSPSTNLPDKKRQIERIGPRLDRLEAALRAERASLSASSAGVTPEKVLVLETVGSVQDFIVAVKNVPGMEWLAEWDEEDILPDEDFRGQSDGKEQVLSGKLFLIATDASALDQLRSLWNLFVDEGESGFPNGQTKWRDLFRQLRDIRFWDTQDRISETGVLEVWKERVEEGAETVCFEAEIWFKNSEAVRKRQSENFLRQLEMVGGRIVSEVVLPEIHYHGVLAEAPIDQVEAILQKEECILGKVGEVMFFRPAGQMATPVLADDPVPLAEKRSNVQAASGFPVVALLDGLPLGNHALLKGRVLVDDPDDWSSECLSSERIHGTAMASLILHGDLNAHDQALSRPIYVRPVLKATRNQQQAWECTPENVLPVDLVHRAVRRLFDGQGTEAPAAPRVCIINLSIGDRHHCFDRSMSPMARLLDWLAWEYKVLFIVSAGNQLDDIMLDLPQQHLASLSPIELQAAVIKALLRDCRLRRIRPPGEAINCLTVGAVHDDASSGTVYGYALDVYEAKGLPSPLSPFGFGYRKMIKPEILFPGGRKLYTKRFGYSNDPVTLSLPNGDSNGSPGQLVATPGRLPGDLAHVRSFHGTSNSTALATRTAAQLYDVLENLRANGATGIPESHNAVLLKALLVHGASWGDAFGLLKSVIENQNDSRYLKQQVTRFLGYGSVHPGRLVECEDWRVTLLGCGSIYKEEGHVFSLPLPPSLSGKRIARRLIVTLAWLTPTSAGNYKYRRAHLWIRLLNPILAKSRDREHVDWQTARRGTVQHDIYEGQSAIAFDEESSLQFQVSCREDSKTLTEEIPYAVAVTLEIPEQTGLPLYAEVRDRVQSAVRVSPRY